MGREQRVSRRSIPRLFLISCGLALSCIPSEPPVVRDVAADASLPELASDANVGRIDAGTQGQLDCDAGSALCSDRCVDVRSSTSHCGSCGHACKPGVECIGGNCAERAVEVGSGSDFGCARYESGDVWCWGWNQFGQVGARPLDSDPQWDDGSGSLWRYRAPVRVEGLSDAVRLSLGFRFACALRASGRVACWGQNQLGQAGTDPALGEQCDFAAPAGVKPLTTPCEVTPVDVSGITGNVLELSVAGTHACARTESEVYCWGDNLKGQLGRKPTETMRSYAPLVVSNIGEQVVSLRAQSSSTCAALVSGKVKCWGDNSAGQLGRPQSGEVCNEATPCSTQPDYVLSSAGVPFEGVMSVSLGRAHTCALKDDRTVWCWGFQKWGVLGDGVFDETARWQPAQVEGLAPNIASIASGNWTQGAIDEHGTAWMWGINSLGVLGNGTLDGESCPGRQPCRPLPGRVVSPGLGPIRSLAMGMEAAFAVDDRGAVWGWGGVGYGAMGRAPDPVHDRGDCSFPDFPQRFCNPQPQRLVGLPSTPR